MMGTVNFSTVQWQDLPSEGSLNDANTIVFDDEDLMFAAQRTFFNETFITSIGMEKTNRLISIKVRGKKIVSMPLGVMEGIEGHMNSERTSTDGEEMHFKDKIPGLAPGNEGRFTVSTNKKIILGKSGDSFIPFFDTSDVTFGLKAPLAGIGFYHYTNHPDYAGFIRPQVIALDYASFLK